MKIDCNASRAHRSPLGDLEPGDTFEFDGRHYLVLDGSWRYTNPESSSPERRRLAVDINTGTITPFDLDPCAEPIVMTARWSAR